MSVLVTGGAGYIGAFVVRALRDAGQELVVIDDLSRGHRAVLGEAPLYVLHCGDAVAVEEVLRRHAVDAVIHLAGLSQVGESVLRPGLYWQENLGAALGLLTACRRVGVTNFVFSSTAAVYGEPERLPIDEDHPTLPTNPYGATKRAVETILAECHTQGALDYVSLRYFNAAGAASDGSLGEDHAPETHLIPLAIEAALGRRPPLTVFGTDYSTADGTCLRDYVHVVDLARAHLMALDWLRAHPGQNLICNLGGGEGRSVRQVIEAVAQVGRREVPHQIGARRSGDPAILVASIARAREQLGWRPERSDLQSIVSDAWRWHSQQS